MRKIIIFSVFSIMSLIACKENEIIKNQKKEQSNSLQTIKVSKEISIGDVYELDIEVEGAGCFYAKNKKDYNNNKCIFTTSYKNYDAVMNINNELQKLELVKTDSISDKISKSIYKNNSYLITIQTEITEVIDYSSTEKGTIEVEKKDGKKVSTTLFGGCGC